MSTSLLTRATDNGLAAVQRLKNVSFALAQTSVASGLAWYLAHDVLAHPQPFFAPIAAAVCLSISNVLRAQRAVQMMIGVTLGIGTGTAVLALLGTGAVAIGVVTLIALSVAVLIGRGFIGQGMMFANQTVVSSILVLALPRSGVGYERVYDALIGGCLASCSPYCCSRPTRSRCCAGRGSGCWTRCTVSYPARRISPPRASGLRPTGRCQQSITCTNRSAG
jgi:Fusaric acid resistance protein-like